MSHGNGTVLQIRAFPRRLAIGICQHSPEEEIQLKKHISGLLCSLAGVAAMESTLLRRARGPAIGLNEGPGTQRRDPFRGTQFI